MEFPLLWILVIILLIIAAVVIYGWLFKPNVFGGNIFRGSYTHLFKKCANIHPEMALRKLVKYQAQLEHDVLYMKTSDKIKKIMAKSTGCAEAILTTGNTDQQEYAIELINDIIKRANDITEQENLKDTDQAFSSFIDTYINYPTPASYVGVKLDMILVLQDVADLPKHLAFKRSKITGGGWGSTDPNPPKPEDYTNVNELRKDMARWRMKYRTIPEIKKPDETSDEWRKGNFSIEDEKVFEVKMGDPPFIEYTHYNSTSEDFRITLALGRNINKKWEEFTKKDFEKTIEEFKGRITKVIDISAIYAEVYDKLLIKLRRYSPDFAEYIYPLEDISGIDKNKSMNDHIKAIVDKHPGKTAEEILNIINFDPRKITVDTGRIDILIKEKTKEIDNKIYKKLEKHYKKEVGKLSDRSKKHIIKMINAFKEPSHVKKYNPTDEDLVDALIYAYNVAVRSVIGKVEDNKIITLLMYRRKANRYEAFESLLFPEVFDDLGYRSFALRKSDKLPKVNIINDYTNQFKKTTDDDRKKYFSDILERANKYKPLSKATFTDAYEALYYMHELAKLAEGKEILDQAKVKISQKRSKIIDSVRNDFDGENWYKISPPPKKTSDRIREVRKIINTIISSPSMKLYEEKKGKINHINAIWPVYLNYIGKLNDDDHRLKWWNRRGRSILKNSSHEWKKLIDRDMRLLEKLADTGDVEDVNKADDAITNFEKWVKLKDAKKLPPLFKYDLTDKTEIIKIVDYIELPLDEAEINENLEKRKVIHVLDPKNSYMTFMNKKYEDTIKIIENELLRIESETFSEDILDKDISLKELIEKYKSSNPAFSKSSERLVNELNKINKMPERKESEKQKKLYAVRELYKRWETRGDLETIREALGLNRATFEKFKEKMFFDEKRGLIKTATKYDPGMDREMDKTLKMPDDLDNAKRLLLETTFDPIDITDHRLKMSMTDAVDKANELMRGKKERDFIKPLVESMAKKDRTRKMMEDEIGTPEKKIEDAIKAIETGKYPAKKTGLPPIPGLPGLPPLGKKKPDEELLVESVFNKIVTSKSDKIKDLIRDKLPKETKYVPIETPGVAIPSKYTPRVDERLQSEIREGDRANLDQIVDVMNSKAKSVLQQKNISTSGSKYDILDRFFDNMGAPKITPTGDRSKDMIQRYLLYKNMYPEYIKILDIEDIKLTR